MHYDKNVVSGWFARNRAHHHRAGNFAPFGGKKIPELMRGLGKGVRSFKEGVNEAKEEAKKFKDEIEKEN